MAAGLSQSEQFMALFNNLKEAAGNSPERVPVFYKESKAIRDALAALHEFLATTDLERRVFHGKKLFNLRAAEFETAWKEYDAKWRFRVFWPNETTDDRPLVPIDLDLGKVLDLDAEPEPSEAQHERPWDWRGSKVEPEPPTVGEPDAPNPQFEDTFDPRSHDGGTAIELGIEQLEFYMQAEYDKNIRNSCSLAVGAYYYLTETICLNIHDVFRRWRKVPVFFMPAPLRLELQTHMREPRRRVDAAGSLCRLLHSG